MNTFRVFQFNKLNSYSPNESRDTIIEWGEDFELL